MAQINRTGTVSFGDARLSIWEEPPGRGLVSREWERNFKRDVFLRIAQQLRRLGWTVTVPAIDPHSAKRYGGYVEPAGLLPAPETHRNANLATARALAKEAIGVSCPLIRSTYIERILEALGEPK